MYHKRDEDILKEYLDTLIILKRSLGSWFESYLISTDKQGNIQHREYYPLFNPRVHNIVEGQTAFVLRPKLHRTYKDFILSLAEKKKLNTADKMILC